MARTPWEITREMFLSDDETRRLLDHIRNKTRAANGRAAMTARLDELIIECLLFSGLRTSEFCRLRLADTVAGSGEPTFVVQATRKSGRTVYVPQRVNTLVKRYVDEVRPVFLPEDVDPHDTSLPLVFNEHRRPFERTGLYRRVVRILTGAGLGSRASVQLLRHTYGYLAYVRTGGNLLFVQRQLGHAHPMITSIYAQFAAESYAGLADLAGGVGSPDSENEEKTTSPNRVHY